MHNRDAQLNSMFNKYFKQTKITMRNSTKLIQYMSVCVIRPHKNFHKRANLIYEVNPFWFRRGQSWQLFYLVNLKFDNLCFKLIVDVRCFKMFGCLTINVNVVKSSFKIDVKSIKAGFIWPSFHFTVKWSVWKAFWINGRL